MLDLPVDMNRILMVIVWVANLLVWHFQPQAQQVLIDAPVQGQALQGQVVISGTTQMEGFQSYQVSFSYQHDTTNTWFPILESKDGIKNGPLATWDTTTITDGIYRLRVVVYLADGRTLQTMVTGLRVRNYTTIETATPAPPSPSETESLATVAVGDYVPADVTQAAESGNPVTIAGANLADSLLQGGTIALLLFILLGLYFGFRALFRRG